MTGKIRHLRDQTFYITYCKSSNFHFRGKEEIGLEVLSRARETFKQFLDDSLQGATPGAQLEEFFCKVLEKNSCRGFVGGCLIANLGGELEGSDVCRATLAKSFRDWRDGVAKALRESQQLGLVRTDIDANDLADLLTEAWEGAVIRMKIERSLAPLRRVLERLLSDYFRPR